MSTSFRPLTNIRARQFFDGRLEEFDVYEHVKPEMNRVCCRGVGEAVLDAQGAMSNFEFRNALQNGH